MSSKQKKKQAHVEVRVRLYPQLDQPLITRIKNEARVNERTVQQQVRYMLRKAAEVIA